MILGKQQDEWHAWFAWRPVYLTEQPFYNHLAWLQLLERKRPSSKYAWEYRIYA